MYSVKYDSVELVNSTYNLEFARDQSAPPRDFSIVPYATDDGGIITFDRYGVKHIIVKGFISAATPAALQTAVDTFKELFSRRDKNLDLTPSGGVLRRYVANCLSHTLPVNHYNNTFLPYEAEFIVVESVGKATALTELLNSTLTANYNTAHTLTVGSAQEQKLRFTFYFTTTAAVAGIKIRTLAVDGVGALIYDTSMIITYAFANTEVLIVDCDAMTVLLNGTAINFYGTFPRAILGTDQTIIQITFTQIIIEQSTRSSADAQYVYDTNWLAQSFMVNNTDATYRSISLFLDKTVAVPPNALVVTIEGDSGGEPDGSAVATFTIAEATVVGGEVVADNASNFSLTGNTRYWIVFKTTAGDATHKYGIYTEKSDSYPRGNFASTPDSGTTWTNDFDKDVWFKILLGGEVSGAYSIGTIINYYPRYL